MTQRASLQLSFRSLAAWLGLWICLQPSAPHRFDGNYRSPAASCLMRPALETRGSAGTFTSFPSATLLSLALGADLPRADCLYPGNLRFSADGDLTRLCVTYACILSSASSSAPHGVRLLGLAECSPTSHALRRESAASVPCLAPLHCLRTGARPVSCYALFQGMAASKPTSWLSSHPHFISHLARFGDLSRRSGLFPSRLRTLAPAVSLPWAGFWHSQFDRTR